MIQTTDTDDIPVNQLTSGKKLGLKFYQSKAFGYTSLSQMISGTPIQTTIGNRFASFWTRADEKMLLAVLEGNYNSPSNQLLARPTS